MTKEQASEILGVPSSAESGEVRSRFEALYSDYQIRLSNAPTPNLKRTFQEKLNELRQAAETLHPGVTTKHDDLPSPVPVEGGVRLPDKKPAPPVSFGTSVIDPTPKPMETPKFAKIAVGVAVLFAALGSFAVLKWIQASALIGQLQGNYQQQMDALASVQGETEGLHARLKLLQNVRLKVQNAGSNSLRIKWVGAVYVDGDGALRKFDSAFVGYPEWTLRPGGSVQLEHVDGATVVWNGDAVFYSLDVQVGDNEFNVIGTPKDFVDGTLKLRLE